MFKWKFLKLSSFQIILAGFLCLILLGACILALPVSSAAGQWTPFSKTLFTSCSAACVTGLVVLDTGSYWSVFGKCVILLLIQIGGLGVITISTAIMTIAGKRISLFQRSLLKDSISADQLGGILKLTRFIIKGTILFEGCGALLLLPLFLRDFGLVKGICFAVFHSISAFCNAGFDLLGADRGQFSSFTSYSGSPLLNITFILLIVIGGLSFLTWDDAVKYRFNLRKYKLQSKIILITSAVLIVLPAIVFFAFEFHGETAGNRLLYSLFQSVTTRTAGFNTVDQATLSDPALLLTIILMLIGGSPGSTAGGMKTTTLAVLFISAFSVFRQKPDVNVMGRRISDHTVKTAGGILTIYTTLFLSAGAVISLIEGLPLKLCIYETASAIGTVGLTMGITPGLSTPSMVILMFLMVLGRVGGLTMIFAAVPNAARDGARLPAEQVNVG
ncbi:MAG: Trk family potassium uptake protein [Clostridiales bacterium]|nr:Trk family potassium uptake protein [Clostridiales bacterium]